MSQVHYCLSISGKKKQDKIFFYYKYMHFIGIYKKNKALVKSGIGKGSEETSLRS